MLVGNRRQSSSSDLPAAIGGWGEIAKVSPPTISSVREALAQELQSKLKDHLTQVGPPRLGDPPSGAARP